MTTDERFGVPFLLLVLAACLAAFMTNAGLYYEIVKFDVLDTNRGERILVDYERVIKRNFEAEWSIDLYRDGVFVAAARSQGSHTYRTSARLPATVDLAWMTGGAAGFTDLECGDYTVAAVWTINPRTSLMRRTIEARDDFKVKCP